MNNLILIIFLNSNSSKVDTGLAVIIFFSVFAIWVIIGAIYLLKNKNSSDKVLKVGRNAKGIINNKLQNEFSYFQKLDVKQKDLFVRRVFTFISVKNWIGKDGLDLSIEKKIMISASAVQLTFGLDSYLMPHFSVIEVYPDIYTNKFTRGRHKGEVDVRGKIVLSWKYFEKGYRIADDKINLGLHEMAHALDFSALTKSSEHLQLLFERFRTNFKDEYREFVENKFDFLREYGKVNNKEFFAVLVETYFENPEELHKYIPELYMDMCFLLNQDILHNIYNNFIGAVDKISSKCNKSNIINSSNIIKKTTYNIVTTIKIILLYIFILGVTYFVIGVSDNIFFRTILPILTFILILIILGFYLLKIRLTLTKDYLVASNLVFKKHCIDLYNIIAVIYSDGNMEIAFLKDSKYKKLAFRISAKQNDIDSILTYLGKTQILVKYLVRNENERNSIKRLISMKK